jgi:glycine hydroxymethyltransferase
LILIDLTPFGKGKGLYVQEALDLAGITANKNTIPSDPSSPFYPSGIRLGTPALTTRGMKEKEMELIGDWITDVINEVKDYDMPDDKDAKQKSIEKFRKEIVNNNKIKKIKNEIIELCKKFPIYPEL